MDTKNKILELLSQKPFSVSELSHKLKISRQMTHRHLKVLLAKNLLSKSGESPHVSYFAVSFNKESLIKKSKLIFENILWIKFNKRLSFNFKKALEFLQKKDFNFEFLIESSAVFSSRIEGNTLDLNSFLNSKLLGAKTRPKEVKEISDLITAYKFAQKHKLTEENFLKSHSILSKTFLQKSRQGKYRKEPVGIFSSDGLVYLAVEPIFVNSEMKKFFIEVKNLLAKKMTYKEMFFWASWVHLMFVLIHPFSDGNGRAAREIEKWFLAEKINDGLWSLQTEKFYFENREKYYRNLNLGVNYWENDFKKAENFTKMLSNIII